jgi:hypothetical protein
MKKHALTRAALVAAGSFAIASCDKPAPGLDPLKAATEKTVYDDIAKTGTASDAPAPAPKAPEKTAPVVARNEEKPAPPPAPEKTEPVKTEPAPAPAPTPAPAPAAVPSGPTITIKPEMPKPLFAGTPLPDSNPPPNLDKTGKPVLEVQVPEGVAILSKDKPVTCSDPAPLGDLSLITDSDKQGDDGYFVDILPMKQWIQVDLGEAKEIWLIWVWHFHKQAVIYKDVVVQVSDDPEFKTGVTTVFNNDYDNSSEFGVGKDQSWVETNNGRPMPVSGVKGRYVRFWSNGRNIDDTNQYIEVEVYGK